jgi:hypothetical protein
MHWPKAVVIQTAGLVLFITLEFSLFRTPFYRRILEPASNAGQVELLLEEARQHPASPDRSILVVGDSRIGEGFSAKVADRFAGDGSLQFVNGAAAGSTPRSWYYLLRELDPSASRYCAIVLVVDDYRDEDGAWSWADYPLDLRIAIACLRLTDVADFAASFHQVNARFEALRGSLFKGFVYQDDVLAFLANPAARLAKVNAFRRGAAQWTYDYAGHDGSLAGLSVDWPTRTIHFPSGLADAQKNELAAVLLRGTEAQHGDKYRYRKQWFGRILDRYRGKPARIVFVRPPRAPLPLPAVNTSLPSAITELGSVTTMLDENTFTWLERPEYFFDSLHLNRRGREEFSKQLAARIRETVAR